MKILIIILLYLGLVPPLVGAEYEAIIYCNFRNPEITTEIIEHWKPEIPDIGIDEVIRDFRVLEKLNLKRVYHALVMTPDGETGQIKRIKDHIRVVNGCVAPLLQGPECTTVVGQQILAWWGMDATTAYTRMWQDRGTHAVFSAIAKGVLRYLVETTCDGEPCTRIFSVTDAEDIYLEVIDEGKIIIPHVFLGR